MEVYYGGASGVDGSNADVFTTGTPGVPGGDESYAEFGEVAGTADFDGDGTMDLAIGAPYHSAGSTFNAGTVIVLPGGTNGVTTKHAQAWSQDSKHILGTPAQFDGFGASVD